MLIRQPERVLSALRRLKTLDAAIVQAVLGLARGLGVPAVAEGVETEAQLGALRAAGCEEVQGWLVDQSPTVSQHHSDPNPSSSDLNPLLLPTSTCPDRPQLLSKGN